LLPPINNKRSPDTSAVLDDDSPLPISVKYVTMPSISYHSDSSLSLEYYLRAVQSMLMRESLIIRISQLLEDIEESYWTYTTLKIIETNQRNKKLASESTTKDLSELVTNGSADAEIASAIQSRYQRLLSLQKEVAVAIAHFRGLTINVVDSIVVWRKALSTDFISSDLPSIYWNDKNYLLKILFDYRLFEESDVTSSWLAFNFNAFMLPYEVNPVKKMNGNLAKLQVEDYGNSNSYLSLKSAHLPQLMRYRQWMKKKKESLIKSKYHSDSRMKSLETFVSMKASSSASISISSIIGDPDHSSFAYHSYPLPTLVEVQSPTAEKLHHTESSASVIPIGAGNDDSGHTEKAPTRIRLSSIQKYDSMTISINGSESNSSSSSNSRSGSPSQSSVGFVSTVGETPSTATGSALSPWLTPTPGMSNANHDQSLKREFFPNDGSSTPAHIPVPKTKKPFVSELDFPKPKTKVSQHEAAPGFIPSALSDWEALRDYCRHSRQHELSDEHAVDEFWEDTRHHPLVVAAAIGLKETLPEQALIPPLPNELLQSSIQAWNHCIDEFNKVVVHESKLKQEKVIDDEDLKRQLLSTQMKLDENKEFANELKKYQLNGGSIPGKSRDGIASQDHSSKPSEVSSAITSARNIDRDDAYPSQLTPKALNFSLRDFFSMTSIQSASCMFFSGPTLAPVAAPKTYGGMKKSEDVSTCSDSDDDSSFPSLSKLTSTLPTALNSHRPSRLSFLKETSSEEAQRLIQLAAIDRVETRRRLTMKINGVATLCTEQYMKLHPLSNQRKNYLATRIQCLIRCFLAKLKWRQLQRLQRIVRMVVKIQKTVRGFFVRKKIRQERLRMRIDAMMYRKQIAKKFRAALVITNALRSYVIQRYQEQNNQPEGASLPLIRAGGVLATDDGNLETMYVGRRKIQSYLSDQMIFPPIDLSNQSALYRKRQSLLRKSSVLARNNSLQEYMQPPGHQESFSSEGESLNDGQSSQISATPFNSDAILISEPTTTPKKIVPSQAFPCPTIHSSSCLLPQKCDDKGRIIRYKPFLMKEKRTFIRDPKVLYKRQCEFGDVYNNMQKRNQSAHRNTNTGPHTSSSGTNIGTGSSELSLRDLLESHYRVTSRN
jgi:hypothetical protein